MLCLVALVIAVVALALNSGGGSGGKGSGAPTGSHTPIATITAGPAPSGTHISGHPGGRATSPSDGGSSGASDQGTSGGDTAGSGTGGDSSGGTTGAQDGGSGSSGGNGGTSGGTSGGGPLPAGSTLPDCSPGSVQLSLSSAQVSYGPGETPQFRLTAANSGGVSCKLDFGPTSAVFTVTFARDDSHVWASDDCPTTGAYPMQVPAHGSTTFTLRWNEKTSSPHCASPKGQQAATGTYLVAVQMPGYHVQPQSFALSAD